MHAATNAKLSNNGNTKNAMKKPAIAPATQPQNICQLATTGSGASVNSALTIATETSALDPPTQPDASHIAPTDSTAAAARMPLRMAAARLDVARVLSICVIRRSTDCC